MRILRGTAVGIVVLLSLAAAPEGQAHNRSQSHSNWSVSGNTADVVFTVRAREVTRLPPLEGGLLTLEALLTAHIHDTVGVNSGDGTRCDPQGTPQALAAADGYLQVRAAFRCQAGPPSGLFMDSFFVVAPSHVHYARVSTDGELPAEYLFTENRREHDLRVTHGNLDGFYRGFMQYLVLGVEHILGGLDHLAFLAALLLLAGSFRELVWIVTGFTVGHSITLSLAVLGFVSLESWVIEALIGFTIALVAADNIGVAVGRRGLIAGAISAVLLAMGIASAALHVGLPLLTLGGLAIFTVAYMAGTADPAGARRMRPVLTLAFGLVHGFGFANVLNEIGLPENRLAAALGGFNVGVELGQVAVVSALWWLGRFFGRESTDRDYRLWFETASAGLCGLGVFWFVSRSFVQV
jgi:hypothetical protein